MKAIDEKRQKRSLEIKEQKDAIYRRIEEIKEQERKLEYEPDDYDDFER